MDGKKPMEKGSRSLRWYPRRAFDRHICILDLVYSAQWTPIGTVIVQCNDGNVDQYAIHQWKPVDEI